MKTQSILTIKTKKLMNLVIALACAILLFKIAQREYAIAKSDTAVHFIETLIVLPTLARVLPTWLSAEIIPEPIKTGESLRRALTIYGVDLKSTEDALERPISAQLEKKI